MCALFTPQTLYLMITHPSDASGLTVYGCSFALPSPRPPAGDTYTLGTWTVMVTSAAPDIVTLIDHFPGQAPEAAYSTAMSADWIAVRPPDWGNGMPMGDPWWHAVLWLNDPLWCGFVTPAEPGSWGAVKAMYR